MTKTMVLVNAVLALSVVTYAGGISTPTEMTIIDQPAGMPGLFSDGRGAVSPNLYIDSTLPGGDPCAQGAVNNTGYSTFYPGIKLANGTFCNAQLPDSSRRTYTFGFAAGNASGPCFVLLAIPGPCSVTTDDLQYERIDLSSLFTSRAKTTNVHIALAPPNDSRGFSLITDQPATIVLDTNANIRTAVYSGTAKLYPVTSSGGVSSTPATSSFSFPLQIRVQMVP